MANFRFPKNRSNQYVKELKTGTVASGKDAGKELPANSKSYRAGYMQAQQDAAGLYRYKEARTAGLDHNAALEAAKTPRKKG